MKTAMVIAIATIPLELACKVSDSLSDGKGVGLGRGEVAK